MGGGVKRDNGDGTTTSSFDWRTLFGNKGNRFAAKSEPGNARTALDKMKPSDWAMAPQSTGIDVAQNYGAGLRNNLLPSFIGPPSPQQPQVTRAMAGLAEEEEVPPAGLPVQR